jgi:antitoxin (DNA-binding transcriptional repressor) of toxin-antitoxin stability system
MAVTASELRANIYRLLDQVLETGEPLEIERNGHRLRVVPDERPSKLARVRGRRGTIVGDLGDLESIDWSVYWNYDGGDPA